MNSSSHDSDLFSDDERPIRLELSDSEDNHFRNIVRAPRPSSSQRKRQKSNGREAATCLSSDEETTPTQKRGRLESPGVNNFSLISSDEETTPTQKRGRLESPGVNNFSLTSTPRGKSPAQVYNQRLHIMAMDKKMDKCLEQQASIIKKLDALLAQKEECIKTKKKSPISSEIRQAVRDGYMTGLDQHQWTFSGLQSGHALRYDSAVNKDMTDFICQYVIGLYPDTAMGVLLIEAIHTYYQSIKQKTVMQQSGKADMHKLRQVKYERRKRKLVKRKAAVHAKTSWDPEMKHRVQSALRVELMSSESECQSEGEETSHFVSRPIPWRSEEYEQILTDLDVKIRKEMSAKGKRQQLRRVRGSVASTRQRPSLAEELQWVLQ